MADNNDLEMDIHLENGYSDLQYENFVVNVRQYKTLLTKKYLKRKPFILKDPKIIRAFLPGLILKVCIKKGKEVKKDRKLLVLEAMKMNNQIMAPITGKIKSVNVKEGDKVVKDQILIEFE